MTLADELNRVREYANGANPPPNNEANTCNWVIFPLLQSCGYSLYEIHAQGHDPAGNIPDYTVLPDSPNTWFVEAKKWQGAIKDSHVTQASNYANAQGKRWFVVTNGREWRLYDDHIIGVSPPDRLIAAAKIDCAGELEALLAALSKASVQAGHLGTFARKARLAAVLSRQMTDANSEVFAAITSVLKKKFALDGVTAAEVMAFFQKPVSLSSSVLPPINTAPIGITPKFPPAPAPSPKSQFAGKDLSLIELKLAGKAIQGCNPYTFTFPDGTSKQIMTWRDMTVNVVEWLFEHNKQFLLPFVGQKRGRLCLINNQPMHPDGSGMTNRILNVKGQAIYVHVNRSGPDFVRMLIALCEEVGEPADGFRVTLK